MWANYDFFRERAIDPYYEVKYKEPEDRFSPYTTETAKFVGRQFGLSPRKIEHLVSSATGNLGMDLIRGTEDIYTGGKEIEQPVDIPIAGRLFQRIQNQKERKERLTYMRTETIGRIKSLLKSSKKEDAKELFKQWNNKYPDFKIEGKNII
jgi:hypothetical protein